MSTSPTPPRRVSKGATPAMRAEARGREQEKERVDRVADRLLRDEAFLDAVAANPRIVDTVLRRERERLLSEELERQAEERRRLAEARANAPQQTSTMADPYANDPRHDPEFMALAMRGDYAAANNRLNVVVAQRARERRQREDQAGVMWRTRSGDMLLADSHKTFPGTGQGLPPQQGQQRSTPLPGNAAFKEQGDRLIPDSGDVLLTAADRALPSLPDSPPFPDSQRASANQEEDDQ